MWSGKREALWLFLLGKERGRKDYFGKPTPSGYYNDWGLPGVLSRNGGTIKRACEEAKKKSDKRVGNEREMERNECVERRGRAKAWR